MQPSFSFHDLKFFCLNGVLLIRSFGLLGGFMELFGGLGGPVIESFGRLEGLIWFAWWAAH